MSQLFISHNSQDDGFVRELCAALADHGQAGWIDSRELRGGDPLWMEIQRAIECDAEFGHASEPWTAWFILAGTEGVCIHKLCLA